MNLHHDISSAEFEALWHQVNDDREEQAYLDDKQDHERALNLWYFQSLVSAPGVLHRHDHQDGRCFVITRDDRVTGALIWPVLVHEFNKDRSHITLTRLTCLSDGLAWIKQRS